MEIIRLDKLRGLCGFAGSNGTCVAPHNGGQYWKSSILAGAPASPMDATWPGAPIAMT